MQILGVKWNWFSCLFSLKIRHASFFFFFDLILCVLCLLICPPQQIRDMRPSKNENAFNITFATHAWPLLNRNQIVMTMDHGLWKGIYKPFNMHIVRALHIHKQKALFSFALSLRNGISFFEMVTLQMLFVSSSSVTVVC